MAIFAPRYARAMEQVALSQNLDRESIRTQLTDFAATLAQSRDLREFLRNPSVDQAQKLRVLDAIAGKVGLMPAVRNFVAVLMDHEHLDAIDEVIAEYVAVADAAEGNSEAEITSARALREDDKRALVDQATKLAGGNVRVLWKTDEALLGGAVIRIGSTVYDGSVRAQLNQLERHLAGSAQ